MQKAIFLILFFAMSLNANMASANDETSAGLTADQRLKLYTDCQHNNPYNSFNPLELFSIVSDVVLQDYPSLGLDVMSAGANAIRANAATEKCTVFLNNVEISKYIHTPGNDIGHGCGIRCR